MSKETIIVLTKRFPNRDVMAFHVNYDISRAAIERFMRPLRSSSEEYLEKVGPIGTKILKEIFSIRGITEVSIQPYELHIEKGKAFDWTQLEPLITSILEKGKLPVIECNETLGQHFLRVIKAWWRALVEMIKELIASIRKYLNAHIKIKKK